MPGDAETYRRLARAVDDVRTSLEAAYRGLCETPDALARADPRTLADQLLLVIDRVVEVQAAVEDLRPPLDPPAQGPGATIRLL